MTALLQMESAISETESGGNTQIPKPPSAKSVQRTDRDIVAKMVGHLHIAATALVEGRIPTGEKIKHEIRRILNAIEKTIDEATSNPDLGTSRLVHDYDRGPGELALPSAKSVQTWKAAVDELIPQVQRLPVGTGSLSPGFKKHIAELIKDGGKLAGGVSSVAAQAREQIKKAELLYARLSGAYFL